MESRRVLVPALLALVASGVVGQSLPRRDGKAGNVVVHPGSLPNDLAERLADAAAAAVEATRPTLEKWQLLPSKPPTVHLYGDEKEFRTVETRSCKDSFLRTSFVVPAAAEAHVLLHPSRDARVLTAIGLPTAVRDELQSAVGALAAAVRSGRPNVEPWLLRVVGQGVLEAVQGVGKGGTDPACDSRRALLVKWVAEGNALHLVDLADREEPKTAADLAGAGGEAAVLASLFASTGAGWARKLLGDAPKDRAPDESVRKALIDGLLGKDRNKQDLKLTKLLRSYEPRWEIMAPSVGRVGERLLLVGGDDPAVLAALAKPPTGPYAIRGVFEHEAGVDVDFDVRLDWSESSLVRVDVKRKEIRLSEWDTAAKAWRLAASQAVALPSGQPLTTSIEVSDRVVVRVSDQPPLEWPCGKRGMRERWAVGKEQGCLWIQDLRCEPLVPAKKG